MAHPIGENIDQRWSYKVASGEVKKDYKINLEFEVPRDPQWEEQDISFALILYKRVGGHLKFVNAFTK